MDLIGLEKRIESDIREQGISFTEAGYPVFPEDILLREEPGDLIPYRQKYAVVDKGKTVICHFDEDKNIYRRLFSLEKDIDIYREYQGMAGFDLSPRINWDLNIQNFNILLNMVADIYVGLHGIKILPNFRTGSSSTFSSLCAYPPGCNYAVGSLGCAKRYKQINSAYLRAKLIIARPSKLFYYGVLNHEYEDVLKEAGIPYKVFSDFKRRCFVKEDLIVRRKNRI